MYCQACGAENFDGADQCEACGQPLALEPASKSSVEEQLRRDTIAKLPMKTPLTSSPDAPLGDVLTVLSTNAIGAVVITDDHHRPIGIFSERDALIRVGPDYRDHLNTPISNFMTTDPQTIDQSTPITFAVHQMDVGHYRHLPVIDEDGRVTAVISIRDLLRYLTEKIAAAEVAD
ncbi:CBS domain-containing protein [Blastopirellula sp. JC732]|uniref:CBS domain-containing protein n=1 Tax=Blastopirellula sediminis TaxID=2894196 RepID=A0A9X1SFT9_9BACT|nr:CBS domain-containing protein [Blastopirellula sediminis]MCC9609116.1 CBS domain-containing protein [Blastopirellula sediminis]MCC9628107.1 CBS domain-containing protein [Blastopirellula sediminis]